MCSACGLPFDIFEPGAPASARSETTTLNLSVGLATASDSANAATQCPNCLEDFAAAKCLQCGALSQITSWRAAAVAAPELPNVLGVVRARPTS